jgi:hypothetical protein
MHEKIAAANIDVLGFDLMLPLGLESGNPNHPDTQLSCIRDFSCLGDDISRLSKSVMVDEAKNSILK